MEKKSLQIKDQELLHSLTTEATQKLEALMIMDGLEKLNEININFPNECHYEAIKQLQSDYRSMLLFLRNGGKDPQHTRMQKDIAIRALCLLDEMHKNIRLNFIEDDFGKHLKKQMGIVPFFIEQSQKLNDDLLNDVISHIDTDDWNFIDNEEGPFYTLWTYGKLTPKEQELLIETMETQAPHTLRCMLSALLLAVWEYFDPLKLRTIIHFTYNHNTEVRTQALASYVLIVMRYETRLKLYPNSFELTPTTAIQKELMFVQHFLFATSKCTEIYEKLLKLIHTKEKETNLDESIQECMNKAMNYRVDMNPYTFTSLYNKPFFQQIHHWWMPFCMREDMMENAIKKNRIKDNNRMLNKLINYCCDVDLYAVMLILQSNEMDISTSIFGKKGEEVQDVEEMEEMEEIEEKSETDEETKHDQVAWNLYRQIFQDMYRFFTYSKWGKNSPYSPFKHDVRMNQSELLKPFFTTEWMNHFMELLMWIPDFEKAFQIGEAMLEKDGGDAVRLINCGLCKYYLEDYRGALAFFKKAEILQSKDMWLMTKITDCYMNLKFYREAASYLESFITLPEVPMDFCLTQLAKSQLMAGMYQQAFKHYSQMKKLDIEPITAWRGMIRSLVHMNQIDKAFYFVQEFAHEAENAHTYIDWAMRGHIRWIQGYWQEATSCYRKSLQLFMKTIENARPSHWDGLDSDKDLLTANGISNQDICLMHDTILYLED